MFGDARCSDRRDEPKIWAWMKCTTLTLDRRLKEVILLPDERLQTEDLTLPNDLSRLWRNLQSNRSALKARRRPCESKLVAIGRLVVVVTRDRRGCGFSRNHACKMLLVLVSCFGVSPVELANWLRLQPRSLHLAG